MALLEREPRGTGALRCLVCDINYPVNYRDDVCPVCDQELTLYSNIRVHKDWKQRVILRIQRDTDYDVSIEIPDLRDARIVRPGKFEWIFVPVMDVDGAYGKDLEDFSIIRIRNRYYEIQGRVREWYWVEEVPIDGQAEGVEKWLTQLGSNGSEKSQAI